MTDHYVTSQRLASTPTALALAFALGWGLGEAGAVTFGTITSTQPLIERELEACFEKHLSNAGMTLCIDEAARQWEAQIERVSIEVQAKLPAAERPGFNSAHQAWARFRDAEFAVISSLFRSFQGTMYRRMHAIRRKEILRQRAEELQRTLEVLNGEAPDSVPPSR